MNILLTGGTGFLGNALTKSFAKDGHTMTILSRSAKTSENRHITYAKWNGKEMPLEVRIARFDVVINLVGASIADKRWTDEYKKELLDSRINATRACATYINGCTIKPKVFLSASAVGYYGGDSPLESDENAPNQNDFMGSLCKQWEEAAQGTDVRTVLLRTSVILGKNGGAMAEMLPIYKMCIGGRFASGKQGFSWMHLTDWVAAIRFLIENETISGAVNLVAPKYPTQNEFSNALDKALGRKNIFIIPKFALDIIFGERSILFWGGQKVVPKKLLDAGFVFQYPDLQAALANLVK